jgi:hypothetical protein
MRKPARPEVFPDHLRTFLLPVPETRYEALFLLSLFPEENRKTREGGNHGLHDRIIGVECPSPVDLPFLRADRSPLFGG